MRFSPLVDRIAGRGAGAWSIHMEAARLRDQGQDVIFLTVGDPDQAPPEPVIDATIDALRRHRTGYSSIIGYDVSPDGQRFLLKLRSRQFVSQPITVVQNWTAAVNLK